MFEHIGQSKAKEELPGDDAQLKELVKEMETAVHTGVVIDYNAVKRFSYRNKDKYNPFGYDPKKRKKHKKLSYHRNRLCQKLLRIKKELQFVQQHIKFFEQLTPREKEILQLLAEGYNNPKIADQLFISRYTVEEHRKHINKKLQIKSLSHLIQYAYAFDLI